jgi:hypothetical protein
MKPGAKVLRPYPQGGPKTGRVYGAVRSAIRAMEGTFSWRDLCPPLERQTVLASISAMKRSGEITLVQPASANGGRNATPALYRNTEVQP